MKRILGTMLLMLTVGLLPSQAQQTCPLSATVSVSAAATTEIIPLIANRTIRVCGFSVTMTAAGTAQWRYGTGSDCATGITSLTAATNLATATPWTVYAGNGPVFQVPQGSALCLAAVTGNVVGFVTYALY